MLTIKDINESFCEIEFPDDSQETIQIKLKIAEMLSVFVENYQFTPQYRAGIWDGKKNFWKLQESGNLLFPKGLVDTLRIKLHKDGIHHNYQNQSEMLNVSEDDFREWMKTLELPFPPYDYQEYAAISCVNTGRKVCVMATGSGKSLTIYLLMRYLQNKGLKGLLIVPSVSLVTQMSQDFKDYGMKDDDYEEMVHLISAGLPKHFEKDMTISTWQSLYNNPELFSDIDYIIADEAHGVKASVFEEIIIPSAINCAFRFGFTGTLPPHYADKMTIVSCLGKTDKIITPQGLIERGLATPVEIKSIFLNYNEEDKKTMKGIKKYPDEIKFIDNHEKRNDLVSKMTLKIAESGNTLLMFGKVDHGKNLLRKLLSNKFGISSVEILDRITPKPINEALDIWRKNKDSKFFFNGDIDKPKIEKIVKKEDDIEGFIDSFKSLADYDIYFIYGEIDKEQREYIRQILEEKGSHKLIDFGEDYKNIKIFDFEKVLLEDGTEIIGKHITMDSDISESWLKDNK